MSVRVVAGALTGLLLLASCSDSGDDAAPTTTRAPAPPSTTSTTAADDFSIPDEITPEYAERVINELLRIESEALRLSIQAGTVPPEAVELLRAVNTPGNVDLRLSDFSKLALNQFEAVKDEPGPVEVSDVELIAASDGCLVAVALTDRRAVARSTPEPSRSLIVLDGAVTRSNNPTPWRIDLTAVPSDESVSAEQVACAG